MNLSWLDQIIEQQKQPLSALINEVSSIELSENEEPKMHNPFPHESCRRAHEDFLAGKHYGFVNYDTGEICLTISNEYNLYNIIRTAQKRPDKPEQVEAAISLAMMLYENKKRINLSKVDRKEVEEHICSIWDDNNGGGN